MGDARRYAVRPESRSRSQDLESHKVGNPAVFNRYLLPSAMGAD